MSTQTCILPLFHTHIYTYFLSPAYLLSTTLFWICTRTLYQGSRIIGKLLIFTSTCNSLCNFINILLLPEVLKSPVENKGRNLLNAHTHFTWSCLDFSSTASLSCTVNHIWFVSQQQYLKAQSWGQRLSVILAVTFNLGDSILELRNNLVGNIPKSIENTSAKLYLS